MNDILVDIVFFELSTFVFMIVFTLGFQDCFGIVTGQKVIVAWEDWRPIMGSIWGISSKLFFNLIWMCMLKNWFWDSFFDKLDLFNGIFLKEAFGNIPRDPNGCGGIQNI